MSDSAVMQFCRSRNADRRCTRELGHRGLHRHRTIMWTDATADPARCSGSGAPGAPAAQLPDGYPHGRALCGVCHRFVDVDEGVLAEHDTSDAPATAAEEAQRRGWFNTLG